VIIRDRSDNNDELTAEELVEIDAGIAEADRGEVVPAEQVLQEIREILYGPERR
jgi:predicted transcriptional regulator